MASPCPFPCACGNQGPGRLAPVPLFAQHTCTPVPRKEKQRQGKKLRREPRRFYLAAVIESTWTLILSASTVAETLTWAP
jgi:hypothetical protein